MTFGIVESFVAIGAMSAVAKLGTDLFREWLSRAEVLKAERQAFITIPEVIAQKTDEIAASQKGLEQRAREIERLVESSQNALRVGSLFDLYSKQLEKYQTETQARAGWSFFFSIVSMVAGLSFVVWGGTHLLQTPGWEQVASGTAIAAIGGAVSAFITKTFLDVHKMSLLQLNHYFRQPTLNAHILTSQRLAEYLTSPDAKEKAYKAIIDSVIRLIDEREGAPSFPASEPTPATKAVRNNRKKTEPSAAPDPKNSLPDE